MIQIRHGDVKALNEWYAEKLIPYLLARQKKAVCKKGADPFVRALTENLKALAEDDIKAIIQMPWEDAEPQGRADDPPASIARKLGKRCPTIRAYLKMCDRRATGNGLSPNQECLLLESDRAVKHFFDYRFLEILGASGESRGKRAYRAENSLRRELVERLHVPICPYCNRQYIHTVYVGSEKRYLGDLDHILPKSIYPLFSLSLWNLVPSCKACNQSLKRNDPAALLNPNLRGFNGECIMELRYRDAESIAGLGSGPIDLKWTVQPETDEAVGAQMENNLSVFHLNQIYRHHAEDVRGVLRKRYLLESAGYQKSVLRLQGIVFPDPKLIYNVSLDPDKFQEEPLSKMIYDVVERN